MDISEMFKIKMLTEGCFGGAGYLIGKLFGHPQNLSETEIRNHALETFAFILAYLCYSDGVSLNEAGNCITCCIALAFKSSKERFNQAVNALDFYIKIFMKYKDNSEIFLKDSILLYNLKHPQTWNDFNNGMPLEELDFFEITEGSIKLKDFLKNYLPDKINPILESMDK